MADNKFKRVEPDDPSRCQSIGGHGQCPYKAMESSIFCPMHSGSSQQRALETANQKMYRLAKWRDRMAQFADDDKIKSLREEIGILRIVMEETVNMCQNSNDLLM